MSNDHDDFADIINDPNSAGVFEGAGINDYEGVKQTIGPDGVKVRMNCRRCNKPSVVTLEWKELFVVGSNGAGKSVLWPTGWEYSQNNGTLYPANVPCPKCRTALCPHVTPDEAREHVNDAVNRGFITHEQAGQWLAEINAWRTQNG